MSRPIKLSNNVVKTLLENMAQALLSNKVFDSDVELTYKVPDYEDGDRASLVFEPTAFTKMLSLVNAFDTEVAWHGTVQRDENTFTITDILVYPQQVTGATVNTDQEEYEKWLYDLDEEQFNGLRFQGHSHVNMGTSPSSVDLTHQERIVEQLEDDMYYIFLIWNKKMDYTIKIFDLATNTLYENKDIDIFIGDVPFKNDEFISEAKDMVKSRSYSGYSVAKKDNTESKKTKSKGKGYSYDWMSPLFDTFDDF